MRAVVEGEVKETKSRDNDLPLAKPVMDVLRRSLATLLIWNGENVKVVQGQLRHTTPKITLEL